MEDYGKTINSTVLESGLRELNAGLHFDMGTCLNQTHPFQAERQGVFYNGRHLCSMDRGSVPEFKVWTLKTMRVEVGFGEADEDDASVRYESVSPYTQGYADMYLGAARGADETLVIRDDGSLIKIHVTRPKQVKNRVIRVGWRHTFERIIMAEIPNVTRGAIGSKFDVDMMKWPVGSPIETMEAIWTE